MKFKKIIAALSAVAMLAANAFTVSAENEDCTYITGGYYAMPVAVGTEMTTGNYEIAGTNGAKWIVETNGTNNGGPICKVVSDDAASGNNSLYLKANGNKDIGHGGAVWAIELPSECLRGTYSIQVDVARITTNWRDYIALNLDGWDSTSKSRLDEGTYWTKGEEFAASNGSLKWRTYTASYKTGIDSVGLYFGASSGGEMKVDNIIITDSTGTVVYRESFEGGVPATDEPEEPDEPEVEEFTATYVQGKYYDLPLAIDQYLTPGTFNISKDGSLKYVFSENGDHENKCKILVNNAATGEQCLYINARGDGEGTQGGSKFDIYFGGLTGDGNYTIQFDLAREFTDWRDYVTLNMDGWDSSTVGRLDTTTRWTKSEGFLGSKGNAGDNGNSPRTYHTYTGTFKTLLNEVQLNFGVLGWGNMFIDNIVITDSTGTVVFSENFEGVKAPVVEPEIPDEPEEDGIDFDYTYINGKAYALPFGINEYFTPGSFAITGSSAKWVLKHSSDGDNQNRCKIANNNAATGTNSLYLAGRGYGEGSQGSAQMTLDLGKASGDGTYTIQFDYAAEITEWRDYVALNMDGWDSSSKSRLDKGAYWTKGEAFAASNGSLTWKTYTATYKTALTPEVNFGVFGWGNMFIDNLVVTDSNGTVIFSDGFEGGVPEVVEPEVPEVPAETVSCTYLQGKEYSLPVKIGTKLAAGDYSISGSNGGKWKVAYNGTANSGPKALIVTDNATNGNNCLYLNANDNSGGYGGAMVMLAFGEPTGDGNYTIQFDLARQHKDWRDYIALNLDGWDSTSKSRLNEGTYWTKGDAVTPTTGSLTWNTYTATYKTKLNPELYFGAFGWGTMHIDNIIITDSTGTVVFKESFEGGTPDYVYSVYDVELEVVEEDGDGYKTVETATKLKENTLLMSKVRIDNPKSEDTIRAYVVTTLFKDGDLVSADRQLISAELGDDVTSNGVISIPSLGDGEYTVNVYVWDALLNPIKDVKTLVE